MEAQRVVGADRDVGEVTRRLANGGSVVVVGPLGSGKSYFTRAVVRALRRQGVEPAVVRAAVPLSTIPLAALDAAGDPRLDALQQERVATTPEPFIIVVDDAHALDPASLELMAFALYTGRARALLAMTTDPASGSSATADAITELWIEGEASRYDLHELDAASADTLLDDFLAHDAPATLDSVTRQVLFSRSGGSRMLLRELALDAAAEAAAGRDPLDPGHEILPGSRLSDAVTTMLADYSPEQCLALAVVGRIRGVEYATACRYIGPGVLESLLALHAIHTDDSPARLLHANRMLAREAERRLAPGLLAEALDSLVTRALAAPGMATGGPIDRLIASAWHSLRAGVPGLLDVPENDRFRILGSAARHANADGSPDLALAYARLGLEHGGCPSLRLEASRAYAGLRRFADAYAALPVYPTGLGTADLRRLVRWWGTLVTWMPEGHTLDQITGWLAEAEITDPSILCELEVLRAEAACLAMEWRPAVEIAEGVLALDCAHTLAKVRCAIIVAFCSAQLNGWNQARPLFAEAVRLNRDPVTGRPVSVIAELAALCFEAMAAVLWGCAVPGHVERLRTVTQAAAERDDRGALALAGVVSAIVLGLAAHDQERADLEFAAALTRFDRIEFAVWRPLIAYLRVSALTRLGRADQAHSLMTEIDDHLMSHHRIYSYTRFTVQAELSAVVGDFSGLQLAVREATDVGSLGTAALHDRALTQLAHLSETAPDDLRRLRRQRAAAGLATQQRAPRMLPELTEREQEIAQLVARQLSNKEIAQRLFLSVRTVESHVYTARGKVGARSRRELGRLVSGRDAPGSGQAGGER
jgi:DNA-binding CsgD family transcriptional regulator